MDFATHVAHLTSDGSKLASAAEHAGLDAAVPTCPEWAARDLVQHIGRVHRWAASIVRDRLSTPPQGDDDSAALPGDESLVDWYRASHADLVRVLSDAPADVECWSFLPAPTPLRFWARRQAHETAIHRVDAEQAAGLASSVDPMLAVDGIDELLHGFFARPGGRLVADPPVRLGLRAADTGNGWTVTIGADGRSVVPTADDADCLVTAPASELYLLVWNRREAGGLDVQGGHHVLDLWRDHATVTWK